MGLGTNMLVKALRTAKKQMPHKEHIHIEGDYRTAQVYVYDGAPLKSVKKGEQIRLSAVKGNITMESTLTGTVWSSKDDGDIPLAYKGKLIGFTPGAYDVVKLLLHRGHTVSFTAKCTGMYAKGIPNLEVLLPSKEELNALIDPNQKAKNEGLIISYNIDEDKYDGTLRIMKKRRLDAEIVYLPKKEGSTAKPRIAIVSEDGETIDEFGATKHRYKQFVDFVGQNAKVTVEARQSKIEEGAFYYHFEVDLR